MTQEDKELLVKDLCARLPYGVKIALKNNGSYHHENVAKKGDVTIDILKGFNGNYFSIRYTNPLDWDWYDDDIDIEDIKPYLFPLSSMTAEQKRNLISLFNCHVEITQYEIKFADYQDSNMDNWNKVFNWCYKNHFDINSLIPMGLANDATNKNIY